MYKNLIKAMKDKKITFTRKGYFFIENFLLSSSLKFWIS